MGAYELWHGVLQLSHVPMNVETVRASLARLLEYELQLSHVPMNVETLPPR